MSEGSLGVGVTVVATMALVVTACTGVFDYPESETERGASLCANGADDDFDGKADCDDPECDGSCPEAGAACGDGRDNDGDGFADGADPRCWPAAAPTVQRCAGAAGAEIHETFDVPPWNDVSCSAASCDVWSTWQRHGDWSTAYASGTVVAGDVRVADITGDREDPDVLFLYNTTGSPELGDNLGTLVRQPAFAGSWKGFALSFSVSVPARSMLRAAIVPIELAPVVDPPLPGAETASFAVTIDASVSPATLSLDVEGARVSVPVPFTEALCGGTVCGETMAEVAVKLDGDDFVASFAYPGGRRTEVRARAPRSRSLAPSRLVFWGGASELPRGVALDDVDMTVQPVWPCGFAAPQIPGTTCDPAVRFGAFGQGVSVARHGGADPGKSPAGDAPGKSPAGDDPEGEYCALVTAAGEADADAPELVTAWSSVDGSRWTAASSPAAFDLPEGATLVGAGIGADADGFHAAVVYRKAGGAAELAFADADACDHWGSLVVERALFDDAEAPSYVASGGRREVYFTRPPTDDTQRTLWRLPRGAPAVAPELLQALPLDVAAPVSVQAATENDLVLAYPNAPGAGAAGVGFLVSDEGGRKWTPVLPSPVLKLPPRLDTNEGRLSFDDRGVVSAALSLHPGAAFVLYAGASTTGWSGARGTRNELSVGTALLQKAGEAPPDAAVVPPATCGDGRCSPDETCSLCADDCPCGGVSVLEDAFSSEESWELESDAAFPSAIRYFTSDPPVLNWSGGEPTWSTLRLPAAVTGDFELSFDLQLAWNAVGSNAFCSLYVGLGTPPGAGEASRRTGVFAQARYSAYCVGKYLAAPRVVTRDGSFDVPAEESDRVDRCADNHDYLDTEGRVRVVLRRAGNVVTLAAPRSDGCGMDEHEITYTGALPPLDSLFVGFGGSGFEQCFTTAGSGRIANLALRLMDDPGACPPGKERCGAEGSEGCVDIAASIEHCGACGHACGEREACVGGACACSDLPGILECDGACVDSSVSKDHCGRCGHACEDRCVNGVCDVVAGDCTSPFVLAPTGDELTLPATTQPFGTDLCGALVSREWIATWTSETTGTAYVETDVGNTNLDTILGVTEDSCCCTWPVCNDDAVELGLGSRIVFSAKAGTTYRIGIGLIGTWVNSNESIRLAIGLE